MKKTGELKVGETPCEVCGRPSTHFKSGVSPRCSEKVCSAESREGISQKIASAFDPSTGSEVEDLRERG